MLNAQIKLDAFALLTLSLNCNIKQYEILLRLWITFKYGSRSTHLPSLAYDTDAMPCVVIESQPVHTRQRGFVLTRSEVYGHEDAAVVQPDLDVVRART